MQERSNNSAELKSIAARLIHGLEPKTGATVLALSGDLGAGKTTFSQGIAEALGVADTVSSPTFVIEKVYALSGQKFDRLIHIDAYRIKAVREMEVLGWGEMLNDEKSLVIVEWPERIADLIPDDAIRIMFDIDGDARIISSTYDS